MCSDSTFNLLKRVTDGSFLILCQRFRPFLSLVAQIQCPQIRYTDLKSVLYKPPTPHI